MNAQTENKKDTNKDLNEIVLGIMNETFNELNSRLSILDRNSHVEDPKVTYSNTVTMMASLFASLHTAILEVNNSAKASDEESSRGAQLTTMLTLTVLAAVNVIYKKSLENYNKSFPESLPAQILSQVKAERSKVLEKAKRVDDLMAILKA